MIAILTKEVDKQLHEILDYLESEFSLKTSNKFLDQVLKSIQTLETFPYGYPKVDKSPNVRKCVLNKRAIAYYRINEALQQVEILTIENTRMDK